MMVTRSRKARRSAPPPQTSLVVALQAVRGSFHPPKSLQKIATLAGVSTATLASILRGDFGPQHFTSASRKPISSKRLQGWAESLARLCFFANENGHPIDARAAATEYGLFDVTDANGDSLSEVTNRALARVDQKRARHRGVTDAVLDAIAARDSQVRLGFLRWPPFLPDKPTDLEKGWAWSHTRRLVSAVNPVSWTFTESKDYDSIDAALLGAAGESPTCDLVFGLYDTPFRRLSGMSFVHLPGLGVRLGALVSTHHRGPAPTWQDILRVHPNSLRVVATVMRNEVGHLFLQGPCQYDGNHDFAFAPGGDTKTLARHFLSQICIHHNTPVVFVADQFTCERVFRSVQNSATWLNHEAPPPSIELSTLFDAASTVTMLPGDHQTADGKASHLLRIPTYRIGWGFRNDAHRWHELLAHAQREEIFRNNFEWTVQEYVDLFKDSSAHNISFVPLEPDIEGRIAIDFANTFIDLLTAPESQIVDADKIEQRVKRAWTTNY